MILIGRYLSPYVRRVATTLELFDMAFEHMPLQHTGDDVPQLRSFNPIGRVPALVLDDEQVIIESSAILDYLDREVGPERALLPATGVMRNRALSQLGIATGAIDKAIMTAYEIRFRPEEKRHQPWVDRCAEQARGGFEYLDEQLPGDWFIDDKMGQVDITVAIGWQFLAIGKPDLKESIDAPNLDALLERMMQIPQFAKTVPEV